MVNFLWHYGCVEVLVTTALWLDFGSMLLALAEIGLMQDAGLLSCSGHTGF